MNEGMNSDDNTAPDAPNPVAEISSPDNLQQPRETSVWFVRFRLLVGLVCSHLLAVYAAARCIIRHLLDGRIEPRFAVIAGVAIVAGMLSVSGLLRRLDPRAKFGTLILGIAGWTGVTVVLLTIAIESTIPFGQLTVYWSVGTFWVAWLIWGPAFFQLRGILAGCGLAAVGAWWMWSSIRVAGLTGDARVEIVLRSAAQTGTDIVVTETTERPPLGEILWPGYLDHNRSGEVLHLHLREDWNTSPPRELWRVPCGSGWSSFAATSTLLFTQEQIDGCDCVTARLMSNGQLLWKVAETGEGYRSVMGGDGPRATPLLISADSDNGTDAVQHRLLSVGPTGVLTCVDVPAGTPCWTVKLTDDFPGENLPHGICASPLVTKDLVIVCPSAENGPPLAAYHLADGSLAWRCSSAWRSSYASPALVTLSGRLQILLHGGPGVIGVDPADGRLLWEFPWSNEWDNNATQPVLLPNAPDDLIVATGYRGGAARISVKAARTVTDGPFAVTELWQNTRSMKTKFCNTVVFDDVVAGLDNGILAAMDIADGQQHWKDGRFGHGQLLKVGSHLLVMSEQGRLHLLRPNRTGPHSLHSVDVFNRKTWNHPALAGDKLLVRNDHEIVCLQLTIEPGE